MKNLLIGAALLAALAAPQAVLAADASESLTASPVATRFEIVDPQSGKVVAVLVPVAGSPGTLRVIGAVRAPAVELSRPAAAPSQALGPNQILEQQQAEIDARFHVDHTP
jgi:hypothetical protein